MTLVELSFIAIAFIGVFGVIGIAAVVTGRTPKAVTKRLNWKKNLDKKALKKAKGKVIAYGAPTDPGNLLMVGTLKNKQVIGVPGCAKSMVRNGFDLILEKACYDLSIDKRVIAELSCGGLFKKIIRKN